MNSYQESVDQIFQSVSAGPAAPPPPKSPSPAAEPAPPPTETIIAPPPPVLEQPTWATLTDWQAEQQWIQEERKRLESYTLQQFALIKQQREELLGRRSGIEETLALREQELNRKLRLIAESTATLEQRNHELAERETALAEQQLRLNNAEEQFQALQQANARMQKENEAHRLLSEQLRLQTAQLQEAVRSGRAELAFLKHAAERSVKKAAEERTDLAAARLQLEQRLAASEAAEDSLRRRVAEIDQLEVQIRRELEERERQLSAESQELEKAREEWLLRLEKKGDGENESLRSRRPSTRRPGTSTGQR